MIFTEAISEPADQVQERPNPICPVCGGKHFARYHQSSDDRKFPGEVRHLAREHANRTCTICGKENSIDVHHLFSIWAFKELSQEEDFTLFSKAVLTSVFNAVIVCEECHDDLHLMDNRGEFNPKIRAERLDFYRNVAVSVLSLYYSETI